MFRYDPPGMLDDLAGRPSREAFLESWHQWIESQIRDEIKNLREPPTDRESGRRDYPVPVPLFFTEADSAAESNDLPVTWNAYPLAVERQSENDSQGWAWLDQLGTSTDFSADQEHPVTIQYRRQDEYCEWHYYKSGPRGPRIVFTAEGPEYWIQLAAHDLKRVVTLYQELVSPEVLETDLLLQQAIVFGQWELPAGSYNPFNKWNTEKGLIHLTHPANTLGAEINLAARATILRRDAQGRRITESRRLIASSGYGSVNRSSDPNIGFGVNITAVPEGATKPVSITLANPVGLYMDEAVEGRITDDQDRPLKGWFKFVRGEKNRGLMAVFEPPPGESRTLKDVYINGLPLQSGAQIAKLIQMVVYAATADRNAPMSPLHPPFYRACIPQGIDNSDLSKVNLSAGWLPDQSCRAQGAAANPSSKLDDAYPELFSPAGSSLLVSGRRYRMTRNA